jgi:hypothetical protein
MGHTLVGLEQPTKAADAYRQALVLWRESGESYKAMESLAGLARASLVLGDRTQALAHVEEILSYMETHHTLEGTREPLWVYLTCYRILRASGDARAPAVLNDAYCLLQESAANIPEGELRRSFLENVAAHRAIVAEWNEERP